ncbi:YggT family protein [Pseudogracilibacillus sp. SO30301A]|uniref:YggT family protein n=1 Tax=Pseudogracilibacillus sp. SO30301A TaxID=3098291 RepID=UPI00300E3F55
MGQILGLINGVITIYSYALIVYILMSWFPGARESQFGMFLGRICEPYLEQFRKIIPPIGMIDISPIAAIFVLHLARIGVLELFRMIGW